MSEGFGMDICKECNQNTTSFSDTCQECLSKGAHEKHRDIVRESLSDIAEKFKVLKYVDWSGGTWEELYITVYNEFVFRGKTRPPRVEFLSPGSPTVKVEPKYLTIKNPNKRAFLQRDLSGYDDTIVLRQVDDNDKLLQKWVIDAKTETNGLIELLTSVGAVDKRGEQMGGRKRGEIREERILKRREKSPKRERRVKEKSSPKEKFY